MMKSADFLMVLNFLLLSVERLKENLHLQYGMGGPLLRGWVEGCCSKEFLAMSANVVRANATKLGGRHILGRRRKRREFDVTKGYPGEDVVV